MQMGCTHSDDGATWIEANTGIPERNTQALYAYGSKIFTGTNYSGVYVTDDNGLNWTSSSTGITNPNIYSFASNGINLFAGSLGAGVFKS
jgi:hypothetical protein